MPSSFSDHNGRQPTTEFDSEDEDRPSRQNSRLRVDQIEERIPTNSFDSDIYSSESSLLAYNDGPTPIVDEFPVPPSNVILPHPHAPKPVPSSMVVAPAIQRSQSIASRHYSAPAPSMAPRTLVDTLARAAAFAAQDQYNGGGPTRARNTIRGHTSFDLLSASGPVPIHFALGDQPAPSNPSMPPETPTSRTIAPSPVTPSPRDFHPSQAATDAESIRKEMTARSHSFSGILSAIETPRYVI